MINLKNIKKVLPHIGSILFVSILVTLVQYLQNSRTDIDDKQKIIDAVTNTGIIMAVIVFLILISVGPFMFVSSKK